MILVKGLQKYQGLKVEVKKNIYQSHCIFLKRNTHKKHPFKCTSIWTSIIKRLWKAKKMFKVTLKLQRYFVIYIRSPLEMQKIIKQTSPRRKLLETVNFAFMKFFYSLVKITIFWAFLYFLGDLRHALRPQSNTWTGQNAWHESPQKKEKCPKNDYFD